MTGERRLGEERGATASRVAHYHPSNLRPPFWRSRERRPNNIRRMRAKRAIRSSTTPHGDAGRSVSYHTIASRADPSAYEKNRRRSAVFARPVDQKKRFAITVQPPKRIARYPLRLPGFPLDERAVSDILPHAPHCTPPAHHASPKTLTTLHSIPSRPSLARRPPVPSPVATPPSRRSHVARRPARLVAHRQISAQCPDSAPPSTPDKTHAKTAPPSAPPRIVPSPASLPSPSSLSCSARMSGASRAGS